MRERIRGIRIYSFPFNKVLPGEEIILYGFGDVGKQYYWQILASDYCKIKYVVDKNYFSFKSNGVDIRNPESLSSDVNGRIVIGVRDQLEEVLIYLSNLGIAKERIVYEQLIIDLPILTTRMNYDVGIERCTYSELIETKGRAYCDYLRDLRGCLSIYSVSDALAFDGAKRFIRVGRENDGGYIMLNNLSKISSKIAYSFGIADDVSWDTDMANYGFDVYMYDHTIDELPAINPHFHFEKKGIADSENYDPDTMASLMLILERNGHALTNEMILKMDVEGAEYGFLRNTKKECLDLFDQVIVEFHNLLDKKECDVRIDAIKRILNTHLPIHIHANNMGDSLHVENATFADCMEVTFLNKRKYSDLLLGIETVNLPISEDMPCWKEFGEIILGNWNSVEF